jgi:hypothetical protein
MSTIITGVVMLLFGVANLAIGRNFPDRINARFQRNLGWVGIGTGLVVSILGTLMTLFPTP